MPVTFERSNSIQNTRSQQQPGLAPASCQEVKFRDPARAVELATKAVALEPTSGEFWRTLGAARYRAGNWQDAIAALNKKMSLEGGGSISYLFLSMSYSKLNNKDESRKWYAKAVASMNQNQPNSPLLIDLRTEADELLKITAQKQATKPQSK